MDGTDLIVNGEIILDGDILPHEFCDWREDGCFSARMVRDALAQFDDAATMRVNSGGGSPYEGEAIRAAIEAHPGPVTVIVGGVAASAASLMIMSADDIQLSAGSFLMIHNPSSCIRANADGLRREADDLDRLARVYAGVYAAKSGRDTDDVLQMMADTTWLGPDEAVAAGFADSVVGPATTAPPELAAAMALHARSVSTLQMCEQKFTTAGHVSAVSTTGTAGQSQVAMAEPQETDMPETLIPAAGTTVTTPAVTPAVAPAPQPAVVMQAAPQPDMAAIEERVRTEERNRQRDIRSMAQPFMASGQLTVAQVDALIDEGLPAASAGNRFMAVMAASETPTRPGTAARIIRDETETQVEGLVCAMMRDFSGAGEQYRGMRLRGLAMHLSGDTRGYGDVENVRSGMMSTTMMGGATGVSDFAYITTEVMNRTLMSEYDRRGSSWNLVTGAPQSASDFREMHAVRFGGDFQLKDIAEDGEYQQATLKDEAEGLSVQRRGRTIHLTFESVINDDMGALNRIPREFAMSARTMENSMVWKLLRENAVLKSDKKALFHTDHKNLATTAAAISVASVGKARQAMWEQMAFGSKDKDDFLEIVADQLIVPPALETSALQFATGITPGKDSDTNPYKGTLTPSTVPHLGAAAGGSDTTWYLVSSDLPPIAVAYLDGYEAPTVQTLEGMNPDRVSMTARHIFGAAPSEHRGSYKNAGS